MRSRFTSFVRFVVLFVLAPAQALLMSTGCSRDEDKPLTEQQFCLEYARRECAMVTTWCAFPSADACHAARASACQQRSAQLKSGTRPFRPENTRACLDKVSAVYASQPITADGLRSVETICARVFSGNVAARAACTIDYECEKDLVCDKGFCGTRKMVAAGEGCSNVGEVCPASQTCKPAPMGGFSFCQKRQEAGMACSASEPCLETLRCSGTCIERLPLAAACSQHEDCALTAAICDPYAKICVPTLNFAINSDSCRAFMNTGPAADGGVPPTALDGAAMEVLAPADTGAEASATD